MTAGSDHALELARRRYNRIAPVYDAFEWLAELRFAAWRRRLWRDILEGPILEIGVGTGRSFRDYPPGIEIVAIDISEAMLERARRRAARLGCRVQLELADAQALPYPAGSFAAVVSTFVFCSIPEPSRGLAEALRVLQPGGRLHMLEHVLSRRPWLRRWMQWIDPIAARITGAHLDRETLAAVKSAGFGNVRDEALWLDVVELIRARSPARAETGR